MPCQLTWEQTIDAGENNPLGRAGCFTFEIDFDFEPGDEDLGFLVKDSAHNAPKVKFLDVFCNEVSFADDAKGPRLPTFEEKAALERWFEERIREDTELQEKIKEQCVDLVNFEDDVDWDD